MAVVSNILGFRDTTNVASHFPINEYFKILLYLIETELNSLQL